MTYPNFSIALWINSRRISQKSISNGRRMAFVEISRHRLSSPHAMMTEHAAATRSNTLVDDIINRPYEGVGPDASAAAWPPNHAKKRSRVSARDTSLRFVLACPKSLPEVSIDCHRPWQERYKSLYFR